jgi:hypothetical protein
LLLKNESVKLIENGMVISKEEKRRIIDLHFNQGKTIREVCRIMGKSSHDITPVTKEHRIELAQNYDLANGHQDDIVQREEDRIIPNVKAYKLFDGGKSPLEVTAELNLPGPQVHQFYVEYLNMMRMHKLVTIYHENQDSMGYFLKLFRLGKEKGVTPEQIIKLVQMADSIHMLEDKHRQLHSEVLDISEMKSIGREKLEDLHKKIDAAQEKLNLVNETFNVKYEGLKEAISQTQKLQNYVERFKNKQDYQELESTVRGVVEKAILDNSKLLQIVLFSVLLTLRNDPDRYFIIERMELAPFTTNMIINYISFLRSKRGGPSQFFTERLLERAEILLVNLQKNMIDNTISTAAGLEDGRSDATAYRGPTVL